MALLSAIVITRNEEETLGECLASLDFVDEIIVLDSGSTDRTVEIANRFGARVQVDPHWPGFGPQKNRALAMATGTWVLSLDADERVPPALAQEIRAALQRADAEAWSMPRASYFCGQRIKHCGWWPDPVLRLFRRDTCRFSDDLVHERLLVPQGARSANLQEALLHYSYRNLEQVLQKVDAYSTAGARMRLQKGKRSSLKAALLHSAWAFFRTYVIKLGVLDGRAGFLIALMNAEASFYKYAKISCTVAKSR